MVTGRQIVGVIYCTVRNPLGYQGTDLVLRRERRDILYHDSHHGYHVGDK